VVQYFVLLLSGFLLLYQLLLLWGLSTGLASPGPYYALIGAVCIFPFAAAASLHLPRAAACSALVGGVLGLVWPTTALVLGLAGLSELPIYASLPTAVVAFSTLRLFRLRGAARPPSQLPRLVTVLLTALPFAIFFGLFNWLAIGSLILQGPPPWPGRGAA
jgi:hypothetical protein